MKIGIVADIHEGSARPRLALDQWRDAHADVIVALGNVGDICIELNETVGLLPGASNIEHVYRAA